MNPLDTPSLKPIRVRLKPVAESIVRRGHPWVFAESLREQSREGVSGDLAVIFDRRDKFLGAGLYDADSPLRIRVAHVGKPTALDGAFWRGRILASFQRREGLFGDDTNGFRLINGESDGLPGLVLDRYDTTLVLKLYTSAWLPHLPTVIAALRESCPASGVVLRLARNLKEIARARAGLEDGKTIVEGQARTEAVETVVFRENGLLFHADVRRGQKTGFFLDQRENRQRVERLSAGRDVLNCFSFSGGFSLYAARGGARSVTDVDISEHALRSARENFRLNCGEAAVAKARHVTVLANVFDWLNGEAAGHFGIVVIDPPSLARKAVDREGALKAYRQVFSAGIRRVASGGILVAASCSAHVRAEEFYQLVRDEALRSGRRFRELERSARAADHPASFAEAEYLKAMFLTFD